MLAGFLSHSPLGPQQLSRDIAQMTQSLSSVDQQKAHEVVYGPQVAGVAIAPTSRETSPTYQTPTGHLAWLDGDFFNRESLTKAHRWAATSDLEFLVRAVTGHEERFNNLDGIFSAVVFDGHENQLHIVTDRYGLRPLYWTQVGNRIAWASQSKAFLCLPDFSRTIDPISREVFLATGQLPTDRTWLKGVEPIPPATRITFNLTDSGFSRQHYWSWDEIAPLVGRQDVRELAEELGNRFKTAVETRTTDKTGLILSGGLDSRAILAAMPTKPQTFTFGHVQSGDVRIAASVAKEKGADHTILPLTDQNWLTARLPGVWWTDGALDLLHMHGIEHLAQQKATFDICFNGAGGDGLAGAGHLFPSHKLAFYLEHNLHIKAEPDIAHHLETAFKRAGSAHAFYIDFRMRGFTIHGPRLGLFHGLEYRLPFLDNRVQEFLYAIPLETKTNNRLYRQMLLKTFPQFFKKIPWQATGYPISWPEWATRGLGRIKRMRSPSAHNQFADCTNWLRRSQGQKLGEHLLQDAHAHYHAYANASQIEDLWQRHLKGEDHTAILGRYITFELYLRQLFDGDYRTPEDAQALLETTP